MVVLLGSEQSRDGLRNSIKSNGFFMKMVLDITCAPVNEPQTFGGRMGKIVSEVPTRRYWRHITCPRYAFACKKFVQFGRLRYIEKKIV